MTSGYPATVTVGERNLYVAGEFNRINGPCQLGLRPVSGPAVSRSASFGLALNL
jgi:hypothetical protein